MRTPAEDLIAKWRESAWTSNEEGRRINRTVKGVTDAETRCYARAEVWVMCAKELEALLTAAVPHPQIVDHTHDFGDLLVCRICGQTPSEAANQEADRL